MTGEAKKERKIWSDCEESGCEVLRTYERIQKNGRFVGSSSDNITRHIEEKTLDSARWTKRMVGQLANEGYEKWALRRNPHNIHNITVAIEHLLDAGNTIGFGPKLMSRIRNKLEKVE